MDTQSERPSAKDAASPKAKSDVSAGRKEGRSILSPDSPIFKDARVTLDAAFGPTELSVRDILALKAGSVVKLDSALNDLVELRLNNTLIGRGEIVAVDGNFAVRIIEIAPLS